MGAYAQAETETVAGEATTGVTAMRMRNERVVLRCARAAGKAMLLYVATFLCWRSRYHSLWHCL